MIEAKNLHREAIWHFYGKTPNLAFGIPEKPKFGISDPEKPISIIEIPNLVLRVLMLVDSYNYFQLFLKFDKDSIVTQ